MILDVGNRIPRTRPRRSSSAGTLLSRAQKIKEEGEEADGEGDDNSGPTPEAHSPQPAPIPSHSASTSFPFPFSTPSEEPSNSTKITAIRARSTSRASVHSNGTTGSNSTIRQAPKLPPSLPSQRPNPRVPSSSQFAAREQKRRVEALRRKLLDSFISIELAPPPRGPPEKGSDTSLRKGRKRGNTIAAELAAPGSPTGRPGRILQRNASSSSIPSLPHGLSRRRTVSTSLVPTFSEYRTGGTEEAARSPPFFVSTPAKEEVNPCFHIDQSDFIFPSMRAPDVDEEDASIVFPDEDAIDSWSGLRESRIRVQLFARRTIKEEGKDKDRQAAKGNGKVSTESGPRDASEKDEEEAGWKVLTTWDVDLSSLVSLGRNVSLPFISRIHSTSLTPAGPRYSSRLSHPYRPTLCSSRSRLLRLLSRSVLHTVCPRSALQRQLAPRTSWSISRRLSTSYLLSTGQLHLPASFIATFAGYGRASRMTKKTSTTAAVPLRTKMPDPTGEAVTRQILESALRRRATVSA